MGNALWNVMPLVWSSLLGLVTIPIVVNGLGMEHFGVLGLFVVLVAPMSLANMGLAEATIKYVAKYAHGGDYARCGTFVRTTLFFSLVVGVLGGLVIARVGPLLALRLFNIVRTDAQLVRDCMTLVGITWTANQMSSVLVGIPASFHAFRRVAICQMMISTFLAAAGVAAVLSGEGLYGYTAANLVGAVVGLGVWYIAARALMPGESFFPRPDNASWLRAYRFGVWRLASQLGGLLAGQSERFLLGVFLTPQAVGLYSVARNIETRAYTIVHKMSEVLFPLFSTVEGESVDRKLDLLLRTSWLSTSLGVCGLVPMVGLANPLLGAWIGRETAEQAGLVLQLLAAAGILGCANNAVNFYLLGTGRTRAVAVLSLTAGLSAVAVAAVVLPRFGLNGAAISAVVSMVVQQAALRFWILRRVFGAAFTPGKALASLYLPIAIGLLVAFPVTQLNSLATLRLIPILAAYLALSLLCGVCIVVCDAMLPGAEAHRHDLARVLLFARQKLRIANGG
jgi:O-antigen/teichoic acid export membrane protein